MIKWVILCLIAGSYAYGQDVVMFPGLENPIKITNDFQLHDSQTDGQYISTHWAKGKLYYANGTFRTYDSLNFDTYAGSVEVVINNKPLSVLPMGLAGALIYDSSTSGMLLIVGDIEEGRKLLFVHSVGTYILASHVVANEVIPIPSQVTDEVRFVAKPPNKITVKKVFYVWKKNKWEEIKLNKSDIGKLFALGKKELQIFMSDNDISSQSDQNLIQLFQLLNSNDN